MAGKPRTGFFATDEELGKRNDDHKSTSSKYAPWTAKQGAVGRSRPPWLRKRRILALLAFGLVAYVFVKNIPNDMGPAPSRAYPKSSRAIAQRALANQERRRTWDELQRQQEDITFQQPAPILESNDKTPNSEFEGGIKFLDLGPSLRLAAEQTPEALDSTNVVFAASDFSAVAALAPMACEMANWKRNLVHMAIMGNSEISIDDIQIANGVFGACPITWHDARPDHRQKSTEHRLRIAVAGAVGHINAFLRPSAVITVAPEGEDIFFNIGVEHTAKDGRLVHIQIPAHDPTSLGWLARLDSTSLSNWHSATFDIMVQAPAESSGSLVRLLRSLETAHYTGFRPPRLTIELPHGIDDVTKNYVSNFRWPPGEYRAAADDDKLIIRRRIAPESADEASLRFIESFYPNNDRGPHVLLLSPQVELSPIYFYYLKMVLLELKHASFASRVSGELMGISLETPSMHLNGTVFEKILDASAADADKLDKRSFRWQAPNDHATLYFADKWYQAHSFIRKRRAASLHPMTKQHIEGMPQVMSPLVPTWAHYFLEIMRARGWTVHYPVPNPENSLVERLAIVHNDIFQVPEELLHKETPRPDAERPSHDEVLSVPGSYLAAHAASTADTPHHAEGPLLHKLASFLPPMPPAAREGEIVGDDGFPIRPDYEHDEPLFFWIAKRKGPRPFERLDNLPILDVRGEPTKIEDVFMDAAGIRTGFRTFAGGCGAAAAAAKEQAYDPLSAGDLFCIDDVAIPAARVDTAPAPDHAAKPAAHQAEPAIVLAAAHAEMPVAHADAAVPHAEDAGSRAAQSAESDALTAAKKRAKEAHEAKHELTGAADAPSDSREAAIGQAEAAAAHVAAENAEARVAALAAAGDADRRAKDVHEATGEDPRFPRIDLDTGAVHPAAGGAADGPPAFAPQA